MQYNLLISDQPWCPTQIAGIDGDAKKLTAWGYCGAGCPIEADAWRDDDATFIVKYSDDETWKMTAFLIMISTGACLLVIGLLISLLVICIGKLDYLLSLHMTKTFFFVLAKKKIT